MKTKTTREIGRFAIGREDGRSHQQVVIDHVSEAEPGRVFSHAEMINCLNRDSPIVFDKLRMQAVVAQSQRRLLREFQRTLVCIRGVGYRVARANEHTALALTRRRRGEVQLRRGLEILNNVRWDEMDENHRLAHEGMLIVVQGVHDQTRAIDMRLRRIEKAIEEARNPS